MHYTLSEVDALEQSYFQYYILLGSNKRIMEMVQMCFVIFFHLLTLQATCFATPAQTFSGIAQVMIKGTNQTLTTDFMTNIGTSLGSLLSCDVGDVMAFQDGNTSYGPVTISFRAYLEDAARFPACLRNVTFSYAEDTVSNLSYSFGSVLMQNFPNSFADECTDNDKNVAYFDYIEEECQFKKMECESIFEGNRLYRYELYERGSILYSLFCSSVDKRESRISSMYWLQFKWDQNSSYGFCYNDKPKPKPSFVYNDDDNFDAPVHINTLPLPPKCPSKARSGPPIILFYGDQTWDKLPDWIKIFIRVLNGVSLVTLLLCLLTFAMFKELRNTHGKNVLSLVIAGMVSLFYTSGYIPLATDNRELCIFIATLIYYFVLVPNYWWTAVAIFLAWTLGRKGIHRMDDDSGSRFFLGLSLFAWGLPLLFSLLVVFLHIEGIKVFNIDEYCWIMTGWPNYLIAIQSLIPFLMNCVLFVLVVYRLRVTQLELASMDSGGNWRNTRQITVKMVAIFGVFWLPSWIIYVAFLVKPISALAIICQLLNQLSIFILPIVLCCNHRVVVLWKAKLAPLRDRLISSLAQSSSRSDSQNIKLDAICVTPRLNTKGHSPDPNEIQIVKLDDSQK